MFQFRAWLEDGIPAIRVPDGTSVPSAEPAIHDRLSCALGQPVTLAREAAIPHHDQGPVHLVTSASLAWLMARLPGSQIDTRRFRANIVLQVSGAPGLLEQGWVGSALSLGPKLRLRVVEPAERCVMVTNEQSELPSDPEILRELAQMNDACFRVYAEVLETGQVRVGDQVSLNSSRSD